MLLQLKFSASCLGWLFFLPFTFSQHVRFISQELSAQVEQSAPCDYAGTFTLGPFIGQSTGVGSDTVFMCVGDSLYIDHHGDQVFACAPWPGEVPGVVWVFYKCPPTLDCSMNTNWIYAHCTFPGAAGTGFWALNGPASGDTWVHNWEALTQTPSFGNGRSFQVFFAPVTLPDITSGFLGPCSNVNRDSFFSVVFLSRIRLPVQGIIFTNDCMGKLRLQGGLPEWDTSARYSIDISLVSDPSVKALMQTAPALWKHGQDVNFSISKSGIYEIRVSDGKSCELRFQQDISFCNPTDNVMLGLPKDSALQGRLVCLPFRVMNMKKLLSGSFSVSWDPAILEYKYLQQAHPDFSFSSPHPGSLGVSLNNTGSPSGFSVPDKSTLFNICFSVIGAAGTSSPVQINNSTFPISFGHVPGYQTAVTVRNGEVVSRCRCVHKGQ